MHELALMAAYIVGALVFCLLVWAANRDVPDPVQRSVAPFFLGLLWPVVAVIVAAFVVLYVALRLLHVVFGIRKDAA